MFFVSIPFQKSFVYLLLEKINSLSDHLFSSEMSCSHNDSPMCEVKFKLELLVSWTRPSLHFRPKKD